MEVYDELEKALKEIERLNNTLFKREKKWEKWTTEKGILSTKMSEYLCKYHNLKKEYSKLVEINTNRKKEIERLTTIIKEVRERVLNENKPLPSAREIIEILDKVGSVKE